MMDSIHDKGNLVFISKNNDNLNLKLEIDRESSIMSPAAYQVMYCVPNYKNQYRQITIEYPDGQLIKIKTPNA